MCFSEYSEAQSATRSLSFFRTSCSLDFGIIGLKMFEVIITKDRLDPTGVVLRCSQHPTFQAMPRWLSRGRHRSGGFAVGRGFASARKSFGGKFWLPGPGEWIFELMAMAYLHVRL